MKWFKQTTYSTRLWVDIAVLFHSNKACILQEKNEHRFYVTFQTYTFNPFYLAGLSARVEQNTMGRGKVYLSAGVSKIAQAFGNVFIDT